MNRRSFLKVIGVGAGSIATFALTPVALSQIQKFSDKNVTQDEVQQVMQDISDYGKSNLVSRVATSKQEKAILLGLKHHLREKDIEIVQIDTHHGQFHGKAYIPLHGFAYGSRILEKRYTPVSFRFHTSGRIGDNFDLMIAVTEDVAKNILAYPKHLEADRNLFKFVFDNLSAGIIPTW